MQMTAMLDDEVADLRRANAELQRRLDEGLAREAATAEVLQGINSSPGDLASVFNSILDRAMHLCGAAFGILRTYDGVRFHTAAAHGVAAAYAEFLAHNPQEPQPGTIGFRSLETKSVVHVNDAMDDEAYWTGEPHRRALVDLGGARTSVVVPLMNKADFVGAIQIYRQHVQSFSDEQIALLQSFAAQAVIAMENARLITETREALEQQTATAEVLQVINSSPGDLAPVFDAMLEKAMKLCGAAFGTLWTFDGQLFTAASTFGVPEEYAEYLSRGPQEPIPGSTLGQFVSGRDVVTITDIIAGDVYRRDHPIARAVIDLAGTRTLAGVALRKDGVLLGAITIYRQEVHPFSEKQISLLQNFAAQAVIAIENARLITETREALEQQTATAEVLQVINSSPGDLTPVFDAMLDRATRLCDAALGVLSIISDQQSVRHVAFSGPPEITALLNSAYRSGLGLERPWPGSSKARISSKFSMRQRRTCIGEAIRVAERWLTLPTLALSLAFPCAKMVHCLEQSRSTAKK
jgi:GAF domain-containing protein